MSLSLKSHYIVMVVFNFTLMKHQKDRAKYAEFLTCFLWLNPFFFFFSFKKSYLNIKYKINLWFSGRFIMPTIPWISQHIFFFNISSKKRLDLSSILSPEVASKKLPINSFQGSQAFQFSLLRPSRRALSQFWSFKIRRTTFLNYNKIRPFWGSKFVKRLVGMVDTLAHWRISLLLPGTDCLMIFRKKRQNRFMKVLAPLPGNNAMFSSSRVCYWSETFISASSDECVHNPRDANTENSRGLTANNEGPLCLTEFFLLLLWYSVGGFSVYSLIWNTCLYLKLSIKKM